ncbi:MAG TPA: hypothetical protein VGQ57_04275, partial [Polyangiaceae bacterium]|nr:hypothetical protein [Polyangiaceae bacterium]
MKSTLANPILLAVTIGAVAVACGGGDDDDKRGLNQTNSGTGGKSGISVGGKSTIPTNGSGAGTSKGGSSGTGQGTGNTGPYMLPDGYTAAQDGGWLLGDPVTKDNQPDLGGDASGCGTTVLGIVRDFRRGDQKDGHPDFETFTGSGQVGIVLDDLGDDDKPVYNDNPPATGGSNPGCDHDGDHNVPCTTTKDNFNQWYNDK